MSFNIRNGLAKDGDNHWDKRKELVFDVINGQPFDVIGIQEAFRFQLDELNQALPSYTEIGEGRMGGTNDEYSAILYRKDKFSLQDSGTFWLSDTPNIPSKHWGNRHIRICTWVRLIDKKSTKSFYVYNTHLDNSSQLSREKSVDFIANVIQTRPHKDPFIFMGDFNASEDNKIIQYLISNLSRMKDSYRAIHPTVTETGTFNAFSGQTKGPKIDYIFVQLDISIIDANILRINKDGRYPSDHFPITTKIEIK